MDEVFKEIRKRKALAEKLAAEENNGKEFRIYQRAYADAYRYFVGTDSTQLFLPEAKYCYLEKGQSKTFEK